MIEPAPPAPTARIANWRRLDAELAQHHAAQLGEPERNRLEGLRNASSRQRFIAARALARSLLQQQDPDRPGWQLSPSGPPQVLERPQWRLSISHSGDWVAAALGPRPIGIDIEDGQRERRYLAIARHYFHPSEAAALENGSALQRKRRFLLQWTAREAYLKALGLGIAGGLLRLRVDFDRRDAPQVSLCDGGQDWRFAYAQPLDQPQQPTVCIAWQGADLQLDYWDWSHSPVAVVPHPAGPR